MSTESISIKVKLSDGSFAEGCFTLHDQIPCSPDDVQLDIVFFDRKESVVAQDFFEALVQLRKRLEPENIWLFCNGTAENVYPSAMARSMASGLEAYKLTLGKQAKTQDLDPIFVMSFELTPAKVQIQQAFYEKWLNSLKRV